MGMGLSALARSDFKGTQPSSLRWFSDGRVGCSSVSMVTGPAPAPAECVGLSLKI
jgi:hypothetical protein